MPLAKKTLQRKNPQLEARAALSQHKYHVGQIVSLSLGTVARLSRSVEKALDGNDFEIMRTLPTVGTEFQYRLKNAATGQERVVSESEIGGLR